MKQLRRGMTFLLAVVLMLSLAACAGKGNGILEEQEDKEKLIHVLDEIADNSRSGSGGTLSSVRIAADLVSWAASSNMSKSEAAKVAAEWIKQQPEADREVLKEKLKGVVNAYSKIALDGAKDLLKDAGVQEKLGNLTGSLKDTVEAVLNEIQKNH